MVGDAEQRSGESREVLDLLRKPSNNVVVNTLGLEDRERPDFFAEAAAASSPSFRARTGRPHWLIIDEAHHLLPAARDGSSLALPKALAGDHPDHRPSGRGVARSAEATSTTVIALGPEAARGDRDILQGAGRKRCRSSAPPGDNQVLFWRRRAKAAAHRSKPTGRGRRASATRANMPKASSASQQLLFPRAGRRSSICGRKI